MTLGQFALRAGALVLGVAVAVGTVAIYALAHDLIGVGAGIALAATCATEKNVIGAYGKALLSPFKLAFNLASYCWNGEWPKSSPAPAATAANETEERRPSTPRI